MEILIAQYFDRVLINSDTIYEVLQTRLNNYGAYSLLYNKTTEDIKNYAKDDFIEIFKRLYSTQRQSVYNDLISILEFNESSGISFFKGIINRFLRSNCIDIEQLYYNEKEQIKFFSKSVGRSLKFGKGTISQLAHFCRPEKYPLYNTKSKEVIKYIYDTNIIDNNMIEFSNYANEIVGQLKILIDSKYSNSDLNKFVHTYRYVLLDDFIEFSYDILNE